MCVCVCVCVCVCMCVCVYVCMYANIRAYLFYCGDGDMHGSGQLLKNFTTRGKFIEEADTLFTRR